jgi:penicillin-binding protein 1C
MKPLWRQRLRRSLAAVAVVAALLVIKTWSDQQPFPERLAPEPGSLQAAEYLDRNGERLNVTLQNHWNYADHLALHEMPPLLLKAFVEAEDRRFFEHGGVDWPARIHAMVQNMLARRVVRGASTITEQVVRLLHPRPRTYWSRWLEGWEAMRLEHKFSKGEILEFYLNQVPYGRRRHGVVQAAQFYFNRSLSTLNDKELLSLAVMVRAPSRLDPLRNPKAIEKPVARLAQAMVDQQMLTRQAAKQLTSTPLAVSQPKLAVDAAHFVQHLKTTQPQLRAVNGRIVTTIDASLQRRVQAMLDNRIRTLRRRNVSDGAVLVIDHLANEVLAWVNAGGYTDHDGNRIDAITSPRQPGSTLKPFLYAMALEKGWTAATLIDDSPLAIAVGNGLHSIRNYSGQYYGPLRLREALANSLNVPAIRTAEYVGREHFLDRLHKLGFDSLTQHPDFYGDGLGLGNGEVSLFELVRAYSVLARGGKTHTIRFAFNQAPDARADVRVFNPQVVSLIGDILSDPDARAREFGRDSILRLPVQTAVKTGTSTDYRDAWAVGFSYRYTVGVWMGNMDQRPMQEVTGSTGPGMVLRAVFAELNRFSESRPLVKSLQLHAVRICPVTGLLAAANGPSVVEWFRAGKAPTQRCTNHHDKVKVQVAVNGDHTIPKLKQPLPGLQMAMDPRIPDSMEVLPFEVEHGETYSRVQWILDGKMVASVSGTKPYSWSLQRGQHTVFARLWKTGMQTKPLKTRTVHFIVK